MITITKDSNFASLYNIVADCYSTYSSLGNHYAEGLSIGNSLSGLDFGNWNDPVSSELMTYRDQLLQGLQAISNDLSGGAYVQLGAAIEALGNNLGLGDAVQRDLNTLYSYRISPEPTSKDKRYRAYQILLSRIRAYEDALDQIVSNSNSIMSQIPSITFGSDVQFQAPANIDVSGLTGVEGLDELIPDVNSSESAFNGGDASDLNGNGSYPQPEQTPFPAEDTGAYLKDEPEGELPGSQNGPAPAENPDAEQPEDTTPEEGGNGGKTANGGNAVNDGKNPYDYLCGDYKYGVDEAVEFLKGLGYSKAQITNAIEKAKNNGKLDLSKSDSEGITEVKPTSGPDDAPGKVTITPSPETNIPTTPAPDASLDTKTPTTPAPRQTNDDDDEGGNGGKSDSNPTPTPTPSPTPTPTPMPEPSSEASGSSNQNTNNSSGFAGMAASLYSAANDVANKVSDSLKKFTGQTTDSSKPASKTTNASDLKASDVFNNETTPKISGVAGAISAAVSGVSSAAKSAISTVDTKAASDAVKVGTNAVGDTLKNATEQIATNSVSNSKSPLSNLNSMIAGSLNGTASVSGTASSSLFGNLGDRIKGAAEKIVTNSALPDTTNTTQVPTTSSVAGALSGTASVTKNPSSLSSIPEPTPTPTPNPTPTPTPTPNPTPTPTLSGNATTGNLSSNVSTGNTGTLSHLSAESLTSNTTNPGNYDPYSVLTEGSNALKNDFNNSRENVYVATVDLHDGYGNAQHMFSSKNAYDDCVRFANMNEQLNQSIENKTPITLNYTTPSGKVVPVELEYDDSWGGVLSSDLGYMYQQNTTWNSESSVNNNQNFEASAQYPISGWGYDGYGQTVYFDYFDPDTGQYESIRADELFNDPSWNTN